LGQKQAEWLEIKGISRKFSNIAFSSLHLFPHLIIPPIPSENEILNHLRWQ
jgi:hypothetical protein